ncbi:hypothetical protein J2Z49_000628 [Desulfofundulus luciae]|uniref:Uncharacterized protein n=1 Tax=Desulfofundulus luciae TaxID=74702 RepID=A0ABU0AYJ5_9FIRM|nr:hypothetical protein [Desulfofundulus luciae]
MFAGKHGYIGGVRICTSMVQKQTSLSLTDRPVVVYK